MRRSHSSFKGLPLFSGEPDIWKSLDDTIQEQVLDALAVLLLSHLGRTGVEASTKNVLQEERDNER